jgi:hypothetical protein
MSAPICLYYQLTNFYSNNRDYVQSRSYPQLRNKPDTTDYKYCVGAKTVEEIFNFNSSLYYSYWGYPLDPKSVANPCGLAAKALFNGKIK